MNKNQQITMLLCIVLVFALGSVSANASDGITLTIWTFGAFFTDYYNEIIPSFEAMNPGITVEVSEMPGSILADNLQAAFISGRGAPDIVDVEQGWMSRFFVGEVGFIPLDDRIAPYADDYVMARTDPYSHEGVAYGIDHSLSPVVLYYRADILEEAGVATPIETWDEFVAIGKQLSDGHRFMTSLADDGWGDFWMLLLQNGGGFFGPDGEVIIDNDIAIETLTFYVDMINEGVAMVSPAGPAIYAAMTDGRILSKFGADWYGGFIRQNVPDLAGKWKAMPLPRWREGGSRTSVHGGTAYTITRQSQHPDEAWKFIEYALFNVDNKIREFEINNLLPPIQSMLDHPRLVEPDAYFSGQRIGELYQELAPEINRHYRTAYWTLATELLNEAIYEAVHGYLSPEAALEYVAEELRMEMLW